MSNAEPSSNMKAVLLLASHKNLKSILEPALNIERDSINWLVRLPRAKAVVQTVLRGLIAFSSDEVPPKDWTTGDPFEGFFGW